jgi:hypothetical protein
MFQFEVDIKGKDKEAVIKNIDDYISSKGGELDKKNNKFSGMGVEGLFAFDDKKEVVVISIIKKPFVFPEKAIKNAITDFIKKA